MAYRKAFIVYYPQDAERNQGFIRLFQEKGALAGIDFSYMPIGSYRACQGHGRPDFVLNRTREPSVSLWYQERGIPVFHPASLVEMANNKYQSILYLKEHLPERVRTDKWCPKSRLLHRQELQQVIDGRRELPRHMVLKPLDGHGGAGVFLTDDINRAICRGEEECLAGREREFWALQGKDCLLQEYVDSASQDLRVYTLGGGIYQAVLRTGHGDFRSNYSLGGSAIAYGLDEGQEKWVRCFVEALPQACLGIVGIDFILGRDGRLLFNEIEEMAGCRMLYQCTSRDIVADFVAARCKATT